MLFVQWSYVTPSLSHLNPHGANRKSRSVMPLLCHLPRIKFCTDDTKAQGDFLGEQHNGTDLNAAFGVAARRHWAQAGRRPLRANVTARFSQDRGRIPRGFFFFWYLFALFVFSCWFFFPDSCVFSSRFLSWLHTLRESQVFSGTPLCMLVCAGASVCVHYESCFFF